MDGAVVGSAELEIYGDSALLRSVAVAPSEQGGGLGQRLVGAALDLARQRAVRRVYLLTETAEEYFVRLGFQPIDRSQVNDLVKRSIEFSEVCADSATAMVCQLR
jgi:amino-acid N-acetyltransferase